MPKVKEGDVCRIKGAPALCGPVNGCIVVIESMCPQLTWMDRAMGKGAAIWWHTSPGLGSHSFPEDCLYPLGNPKDDEVSQETRKLPQPNGHLYAWERNA